jgi:hypothetical protein
MGWEWLEYEWVWGVLKGEEWVGERDDVIIAWLGKVECW